MSSFDVRRDAVKADTQKQIAALKTADRQVSFFFFETLLIFQYWDILEKYKTDILSYRPATEPEPKSGRKLDLNP